MKKLVHVAVGVIFDCLPSETGKVLIAKRADHQHQGGLWEFPGGKVEEGESVQLALQRELEEELGLHVTSENMQPLICIPFHYDDKSVLLDVWSVYGGQMPDVDYREAGLIGKENQPLVWVEQKLLAEYKFPTANKAIIDALLLPKKIAITQDGQSPEAILTQVAKILQKNTTTWIQLRAPRLNQIEYTQLAMQLYGMCHEAGSQLIWNCPVAWYQVAFADGLHLSVTNFKAAKMENKRPIPQQQWLSFACHNVSELEAVQALADYVLVSPVNKTTTHAGIEPLTWAGFKKISNQASIPCYALGGMNITDIARSEYSGGQGIAGIGCFTSEHDCNKKEEKHYES